MALGILQGRIYTDTSRVISKSSFLIKFIPEIGQFPSRFDSFFGYLGPYVDYWDYTLEMFSRNYSRGYDMRRDVNIDKSYERVYATDMFTKEAVKVIENHDKKKPLFLLVNQLAPHSANDDFPMQAKDEDLDRFKYIENEQRRIYAGL